MVKNIGTILGQFFLADAYRFVSGGWSAYYYLLILTRITCRFCPPNLYL